MNATALPQQSIWTENVNQQFFIKIIDQRFLPHQLVIETLDSWEAAARAIREMHVRGAPLIGVTAAFGMYLASGEAIQHSDPLAFLRRAAEALKATRPTAINLAWAVDIQMNLAKELENWEIVQQVLFEKAQTVLAEDIECCRQIGQHGLSIIRDISTKKNGAPVNILTHCNAGWLACVQHGTATAPIYAAHAADIPIHVWVDETRPRNQGARLTAWELGNRGIPHTIIPDNTGGHLMQHGLVDCCIVGSDRTTRTGDVANKIGTYLKALAARDNNIPFYVALPGSTFDWNIRNGVTEIPIEQRGSDEVKFIQGWDGEKLIKVLISPLESKVANYGFDVTPAHLVSGLITERGVCAANEESIINLFSEYK